MDWIGYLVIIWYIAIIFWVVLMWIDKMAKVIIWNYLAWVTCFAFGNLIQQIISWLMSSPDSAFIWISYAKYAQFLSVSQLILVLLLYAWLVALIYKCGRIQVSFSARASTEKLYFIILIPITVISFITGPHIALSADWIESLIQIKSTVMQSFWFLNDFINHLSFWMFISWIVFIIISSHINFKISLSSKATKLPEWI